MAITTIHPFISVLMGAAILGSVTGCASVKQGGSEQSQNIQSEGTLGSFATMSTAIEEDKVATLLKKEFKHWEGTRYRLGGNSRRGIDCSAFTRQMLASVFGVKLPRTTAKQIHVGHRINRTQLEPGDLVFFKPHSSPRHVGVYLGNGQFAHASSSKGVMLSSLDSNYWRRHYWTSRRVLPATQNI